jgi:hypothetical protein
MPSLNELMCCHTTLCIVENPSVSRRSLVVTNGFCNGHRFTFDFLSHGFQIVPVTFQPDAMTASEQQKRTASVALFQNSTLLTALSGVPFDLGVEQDALILDDGSLHDLRRAQDASHSPDRTRRPTLATPPHRQIAGYFHTHPPAALMRPPTPASDWNEVPGVGFPGSDAVLHFMIECSRRVWGLLSNRRAFLVGVIQGSGLLTLDPASRTCHVCWALS